MTKTSAIFGDKRLDKTYKNCLAQMESSCSAVVHNSTKNRNERDRAYNFYANPKVTLELLNEQLYKKCLANCQDKSVLIIQDTTEINYQSKAKRISNKKGLGVVGNDKDLGYFMHLSVVVSAEPSSKNELLGVIDNFTWSREKDRKKCNELKRDQQDFKEKEKARWLEEALKSKERLGEGVSAIVVQDREGDIYESMLGLADAGLNFIIRSKHNRVCLGDEKGLKINDLLSLSQKQIVYKELAIKGSNTHKKRKAKLKITYETVEIKRPNRTCLRGLDKSMRVTVIKVEEVLAEGDKLKSGENKICWKLLTNCEINSLKDVLVCVERYAKRWLIEELFKTLKSNSLNIEKASLESGEALLKLGSMALDIAQKVLRLKESGINNPEQSADEMFTETELQCLETVVTKYTAVSAPSSQNPYPKRSMGWAYWLIGRLGKWDGYMGPKKTLRPGTRTLSSGFLYFYALYEGFLIAKAEFERDTRKD